MSSSLSGLPYQSQVSSTKKVAIPCIRREVTNNSSSQNLYLPNSRMQIPIETGTPGQFIDPMLSFLRFDLTVINPNPCIDFFDLPQIGFGAFIRELTVEVNGMPTETYRFYNDSCSCRAITDGSFPETWDYYVENDWRPMKGIAGPFHVNFIKPCMISRSGFTMYSDKREIWGGINNRSHPSQANANSGGAVSYAAANSRYDFLAPSPIKTEDIPLPFSYRDGPTYLSGVRLFFPEVLIDIANRQSINKDGGAAGAALGVAATRYGVHSRRADTTNPFYITGVADAAAVGQATFYQPDYDAAAALVVEPATGAGIVQGSQNDQLGGNAVNAAGLHRNDTYFMTAVNPVLLDMTDAGIRSRFPLWTCDRDGRLSDYACDRSSTAAEATYGNNSRAANQPVGSLNDYAQPCPARWPVHYNPFDYEKLKQRNYSDKCRVPEEFERLTAGNNVKNIPIGFSAYNSTDLSVKQTRFQVQLPLESVLIGNRAQSWFPATLIPQGKMRINIVWEEPRKAFQVTMDPCRVLNNTLRIRAENMGFIRANLHQRQLLQLNTDDGSAASAVKFSAIHSSMLIQPMTNAYVHDTSVFFNYNGACAMGTYAIPSLLLGEAATGEFRTPRRLIGVSMGNYANAGNVLAVAGNPLQSYNPEYTVEQWNSIFNPPELVVNNEQTGYRFAGLRQCWSNTCHPTPQYLPYNAGTLAAPILFNQNVHDIRLNQFVSETQVIYGTFLEASQPQTRRCMSSLMPLVEPAPGYLSQELTYEISNVSFDTVEYLLPESATASITMLALETGLEQEIDTVKLQQQFLPKAETQKPLINGSSSYVNAISCFFRRTEQTQVVEAFGYNSFSFYNPFVSVSCTPNDYVDVGGVIQMQTKLDLSRHTGIQVQLQIGGEYIPRVPIDDIFTLMRKTMEGDNEFKGMLHHKHLAPTSIYSDRGEGSYPTLQFLQSGFWAPFVPIRALDDQTCTANPYWAPYELDLVAARSSNRATFQANQQLLNAGRLRARRPPTLTSFAPISGGVLAVLPFFKPLNGTFHLSFNLRTFVQSPQLRSGVAIVNNNLFLIMNQAYACSTETIEMLTLFHCEGRIAYERGGNISIFS